TIDAVRSTGTLGLRSSPAVSHQPVYAHPSGFRAALRRFSSGFRAFPGRCLRNWRAMPAAGWIAIGLILIATALWLSEPWNGAGWGSLWGSRPGTLERGRPQEQQVGQ